MLKMKGIWTTFALGIGFAAAGVLQAGLTPTPSPTSSQLILHVQTADGKVLQAPVFRFKALSLAVMATLIKEKKMKPSQAPKSDPSGNMTFYLDKNVPADFVAWAQNSLGQVGRHSNDVGEFIWPARGGYKAEAFHMQGLKVVGFIPADDSNGIQLILAADKTEAFPPLNFKKKK